MSTNMKIRRVKRSNPSTKVVGYATKAIINGTADIASVAEDAARNTTINKHELQAALGIAVEGWARKLKEGYAVDLGPIGKIYPTVSGKWTATAEEQKKANLKKGTVFVASDEVKAAVEAITLSWERSEETDGEEEEAGEEDVPDTL